MMIHIKVTLYGRLSDFQQYLPATMALKKPGRFDDLLLQLSRLNSDLAQQLATTSITLACNDQIVAMDTILNDGDHIALLPPVTGG